MRLHDRTPRGARRDGDALDLFAEESDLLLELLAKWDTTTPHRTMGSSAVPVKWDHGTVGKLLLEHAAVRLAAGEELARVLHDIGRTEESCHLRQESQALRPILDQMYASSRGVQPISLSITPGFVGAVGELRELLRPRLGGGREGRALSELTEALGSERKRLRSATFIRKHAPSHPGPTRRWYDRVPFLLRVHAAEDRLRGFPWGESSLGDRELARRYDREN